MLLCNTLDKKKLQHYPWAWFPNYIVLHWLDCNCLNQDTLFYTVSGEEWLIVKPAKINHI